MDLPQAHTHIPLGGEMYVTSETDESKTYRIQQSVVLVIRLAVSSVGGLCTPRD